MPVLGFNVTKIELEKVTLAVPQGQIEVKLSPKVKEMRLGGEMRTPTGGKINGIEILFRYEIDYNPPKIAQGAIEGAILYLPPHRRRRSTRYSTYGKRRKRWTP